MKNHRSRVGGMWAEIGTLQFDFLLCQGMEPKHTLIDIGCGSFRGGVHFAHYLEEGNYFGIDASKSIIEAGYEHELAPLGLDKKIPHDNIIVDDMFSIDKFNRKFDYAIAQSVFTHLPVNQIRLCLFKVTNSLKTGGKFIATYFICPDRHAPDAPYYHTKGGVTTSYTKDPYHYTANDLISLVDGLPLSMNVIGDWNHPRNQQVVIYTRQ